MNFSDFKRAYEGVRVALAVQDMKTAKKAFKELEKVAKQIEKSRMLFTSAQNAREGIDMYYAMAHLGEELMKPMAIIKYAQKAEFLKAAMENGLIEGGGDANAQLQGFGGATGTIRRNENYAAGQGHPLGRQEYEARFDGAISKAEGGLYHSAVEQLQELRGAVAGDTAMELVVNYNLGAVYFTKIGDGEKAKSIFEDCAHTFETDAEMGRKGAELHAYCLENLMLLSLDYAEYQKWADKLRAVAPGSAILAGQAPEVREKIEEKGWAWWQSMFAIAMSYYNRNDPGLDAGLYGNAASVFDMVLKNRRSLRLPREELKIALYEYNALIIKIVSENIKTEEQAGRPVYPEEYRFMLEKGRDTIDEFTPVVGEDANIAHERQTYTMYLDALTQ